MPHIPFLLTCYGSEEQIYRDPLIRTNNGLADQRQWQLLHCILKKHSEVLLFGFVSHWNYNKTC